MRKLDELITAAAKQVAAMSETERNEMLRKQGESWARAEASWPRPKFRFEKGGKVYDSYEDYLNG